MKTFAQLFEGRKSNYGLTEIDPSAYPDDRGKLEAQYRVIQGNLDPALYDAHLRGEKGLGIVPIMENNTVCFACVDIDKYDDPKLTIQILNKIKNNNWPFVPTRSKSGGLHLWLFFDKPVSSVPVFRFICKIADIFKSDGCHVDTFPRQPRIDNGGSGSFINLPYFGGTRVGISIDDGRDLLLEEFIEFSARSMVTLSDLEAIAEGKDEETLGDAPPCVQAMLSSGVEEGGRNNAVYQMAVYFSRAYPDDWQDKVRDAAVNNTSPSLSQREVSAIIHSISNKQYQYNCEAEPMKSLCDKVACLKRKFGIGGGEQQSEELKFDIPIVKITFEDNPKYQITMYGKQFRVDADTLASYNKFRIMAMKYIDRIPPAMSKPAWEAFLGREMALMKYEDPPVNVAMSETIRNLFENWVNNNNSTSEIKAVKRQGCYTDGKFLWIDPRRLTQAINRETKLTAENIWLYLRNLGSIEEVEADIDGHSMMVYKYRLKENDDWFRPNRHRIEREDKPI